MDVNGVDVDYLNDNEIFELFNQILDENKEEIAVIEKINNLNFTEENIEEIYNNMLYDNQNTDIYGKNLNELNNEEVLALNGNIVDEDTTELKLINGYNIDVNNLSEEEILTLYDDYIDLDKVYLAASWNMVLVSSCEMVFYKGVDCKLSDGRVIHTDMDCPYKGFSSYCSSVYYRATAVAGNSCYFYYSYTSTLTTYSGATGQIFCYLSGNYLFTGAYAYWILK